MDLIAPTIADQIQEVEREIALRRRVYPLWIQKRRISKEKADRQLAVMEAVLETLRSVEITRA